MIFTTKESLQDYLQDIAETKSGYINAYMCAYRAAEWAWNNEEEKYYVLGITPHTAKTEFEAGIIWSDNVNSWLCFHARRTKKGVSVKFICGWT